MPHTIRALLIATAICAAAAGCQRATEDRKTVEDPAVKAFARQEQAWRDERHQKLIANDGWTTLIGLHWIEPGAHYVGASADNGIHLSMGPQHLGMIELKGDTVRFVPAKDTQLTLDGQPLAGPTTLRTDADPQGPSAIGFDGGDGVATVIERGGRHALRVKHAQAPTRTGFTGIPYWPAEAQWKVQGRFIPHEKGRTMEVANIIGTTDQVANPGVVEFQRDGRTFRIEAIDEGEGVLFLVFADRTNGHGSYGAGRFLDAPLPDARGNVVLDFNQSRNPPCAFTAFATCPLPPPENRLDLAITAGEKAYHAPSPRS